MDLKFGEMMKAQARKLAQVVHIDYKATEHPKHTEHRMTVIQHSPDNITKYTLKTFVFIENNITRNEKYIDLNRLKVNEARFTVEETKALMIAIAGQ